LSEKDGGDVRKLTFCFVEKQKTTMSSIIIETNGVKPLFRYVKELKKMDGIEIERTVGRTQGIVIKNPGGDTITQIKTLSWVVSVKEYKDILLEVVMDDKIN
jgi:hypothetical protein